MDQGLKNRLKSLIQDMFNYSGCNYTESLDQTDIDTIKTDIDNLENSDLIDNFVMGSDYSTVEHVELYMPNLTTNDQKLLVVVAIQSL